MPEKIPELKKGRKIDGYVVQKCISVMGAASTVYRIRQTSLPSIPRALKLLQPDSELIEKQEFRQIKKWFLDEIAMLSRVTHRNVIKIIDAGQIEGTDEWLYYIMEHIPGPGCKKADLYEIFNTSLSSDVLLDIFLQILDGLAYLHNRGILHCDIKPSNILCQYVSKDNIEVCIGDLGVSKVLPAKQKARENRNKTRRMTKLRGSPPYAPPYAKHIFKPGVSIDRRELRQYCPHLDIFCLGISLAELLSAEPLDDDQRTDRMMNNLKPNIQQAFSESELEILRLIVHKMTLPEFNNPGSYQFVSEVIRDVLKIREDYLQPLGLPEFAIGGHPEAITFPGVRAPLSLRMKELVNHPTVQRLHSQHQLHLLYHVFPGARHSRFENAVVTYAMIQRYVAALVGDSQFRYMMNPADYELLCVASLLYNIGYYPLARAFDDLVPSITTKAAKLGRAPISHRDLKEYFLELKPKGGGPSLKRLFTRKPRTWSFHYDALVRVICKQQPKTLAEGLIQSIIDGPCGAATLAFLHIDSHHSGVAFGRGIDLEGFFAGLYAAVVEEEPPKLERRRAELGVKLEAAPQADSFSVARCGMYSRVYWHHTNRAMMAMVKHVARTVFNSNHKLGFKQFIEQTCYRSEHEALWILANAYDKVTGEKKCNPARLLLGRQRQHYRVLLSISAGQNDSLTDLYNRLDEYASDEDKLEVIRSKVADLVSKHVSVPFSIRSGVLLDVPRLKPERDMFKPFFTEGTEGKGSVAATERLSQTVYKQLSLQYRRYLVLVTAEVRDSLRTSRTLSGVQENVISLLEKVLKKQ